jgi:hypothetical protein
MKAEIERIITGSKKYTPRPCDSRCDRERLHYWYISALTTKEERWLGARFLCRI